MPTDCPRLRGIEPYHTVRWGVLDRYTVTPTGHLRNPTNLTKNCVPLLAPARGGVQFTPPVLRFALKRVTLREFSDVFARADGKSRATDEFIRGISTVKQIFVTGLVRNRPRHVSYKCISSPRCTQLMIGRSLLLCDLPVHSKASPESNSSKKMGCKPARQIRP